MNHPWSVWLEPCKKDRIQLQSLITQSCTHFNSPVFNPHLTLFGRMETDPVSAFSYFDNIVIGFEPISLNVMGVKTGTPPWKVLYLQFEKK